jgi:hypothetical protein
MTTLLLLSLLVTAFWTNCGRQRDGWLAAQGQPTRVSLPSHGCESCHVGIESTHQTADGKTDKTLNISCVDCHGGDGTLMRPANTQPGDAAYETAKRRAHVAPSSPKYGKAAAFPNAFTRLGFRKTLLSFASSTRQICASWTSPAVSVTAKLFGRSKRA